MKKPIVTLLVFQVSLIDIRGFIKTLPSNVIATTTDNKTRKEKKNDLKPNCTKNRLKLNKLSTTSSRVGDRTQCT